jgi:myo-inositol-1(or 4)-monophosphatase
MYRNFIQQLLQQTSKIAHDNFGKTHDIKIKPADNNQILTETDLAIGTHAISLIKSAYPGYNIIDEEAGIIDNHSEYTWVIDPIDGTSNFAMGVETYGTIIGLLYGDIPIAGGIALPFFQEIITAEKGKGAYCNGTKIHVTHEIDLSKTLVACFLDGHSEEPSVTASQAQQIGKIALSVRSVRDTNSVYDLVNIAKGRYGAITCFDSKIWDNVGQQTIIEEAGGVYTDITGFPMVYSAPLSRSKQNFTYCAGSASLHSQLISLLKQSETS